MNYGKWETIRELGKGGQGTVYLVRDTTKTNLEKDVFPAIRQTVQQLSAPVMIEPAPNAARRLAENISKYLKSGTEENCAALKVLHPHVKKDQKASSRFQREVDSLAARNAPHIIKILDASIEERWFVLPYYPNGTLDQDQHRTRFRGKPIESLEAFRSLVCAMVPLHKDNIIHRDIKPANIYPTPSGLVLGDFGLVFFADEEKARVSETYENVGSRDWMPPWCYGIRVEEIKPSFDVFGLGKILWAMVSGKTVLQLWYQHKPQFDLEKLFPGDERMGWINRLIDGCVQEEENRVFPSAEVLLEELDKVLEIVRRGGQIINRKAERICYVCGFGTYKLVADGERNSFAVKNLGFSQIGDVRWRIYRCVNCGNIQMFNVEGNPPAWGEISK
jgi:serine/threonine protein kinase